MTTKNVFTKDPDSTLDYAFDWSEWLSTDETITSASVTISASSLNKLSVSYTTTGSVVVWVSEGILGTRYDLTCQIITNANRIDQRTIKLDIRDR
jgi:hypothetical protein